MLWGTLSPNPNRKYGRLKATFSAEKVGFSAWKLGYSTEKVPFQRTHIFLFIFLSWLVAAFSYVHEGKNSCDYCSNVSWLHLCLFSFVIISFMCTPLPWGRLRRSTWGCRCCRGAESSGSSAPCRRSSRGLACTGYLQNVTLLTSSVRIFISVE